MIKLYGDKLDRKLIVACSGGQDSVSAACFLANNHDVTLAYFNHGTETSERAEQVVVDLANDLNCPFVSKVITRDRPSGKSLEEHWRDERYRFLDQLVYPVVTAHTLDDCVETWIWSSLHGTPKLIPYRRNNVIRPFLLSTRSDLSRFQKHPHEEDPSNRDLRFARCRIRHNIVPEAMKVNPGLYKVIRKKLEKQDGLS